MFYRHWKKLALALTGLFWASCDSDSTSANGAEEPTSSSNITPTSSVSNQESSSSEATNSETSSSSEAAKPESSSSDFGMSMPLYGVIMDKTVCTQAEGDSTMTCGDGVNCTLRIQESWESLPCIEDICPDYGVVRISENTYECDGKIYCEAEFRSRYSQVIIPKDSSEATGSETLCFNDSVQNTEGRMFKIIDIDVEGIGEKQAASIRMLIDTFLEKLSASGRIRLTTDIPATNTSAANVSAENTSAMGIPAANTFTTDTPAANIPVAGIAARNTSATGTSSARAVLAADSRVLITLLARSREAALVRRDAEPLREEFHTQVEAGIQAVEIRNRFRWIFSGRQKKERTLLAVGSLLELALCRRVRHLLSLYNNAVKISEKEAVADFEKNSAPYYAWLEARGGISAPQKMIYSSIPAQLAARIDAAPLDLAAFKGNLRAYQAFGTRYILTQKRVLLGDEMGLGKTIQAIAAMSHLTAEKRQSLSASHLQTEGTQSPTIEAESVQTPATATGGGQISTQQPHFLVVCPASVMINWCREIVKFSEVKAHLLHGPFLETSFERWNTDGGAAVTNYESMGKIFSRIDGKMRLALLVIDEAHYIKNPEAKRTRYIHSLEDESDRILLMTGTPLENNVIEMCQLIGFVRPDMDWKIRENAAMRHVPAFREMLAPVYLRRQRDQVLDELPPCTEEEEWCAMTPQDLETYSSCAIEGSFNGMRRVSFLQDDLRTSSKAVRLLELCEEAGDEGKRIVIYSFFRETLRKTAALLEDWRRPEQWRE